MTQLTRARWVLLIHQIPPKPAYLRVKVGRRLQRLGAVPIKNSVYVLPRTSETVEDFQWQRREIVADGGEASVCEGSFVDGLSDDEIEALFRAARDTDYRKIAAAAKALLQASRPSRSRHPLPETGVARLRRRFDDVAKIDFFHARERQGAADAIGRLQSRVRARQEPRTREKAGGLPGTWVTRKGVFVDRIASAWLIRRFIDPDARFKFVDPEGYRVEAREARFDMYEGEYTHEGDRCTFETIVARFTLEDPALTAIAEIVHDIDCKGAKFDRKETAGVERLIAGIARQHLEDGARLEAGATLLDSLYASLRAPATRSKRRARRR